jgi:hypothetical protein
MRKIRESGIPTARAAAVADLRKAGWVRIYLALARLSWWTSS